MINTIISIIKLRREWDGERLKGGSSIIFLKLGGGSTQSILHVLYLLKVMEHLWHEKGVKNSTVYCSYFCNAKLPSFGRHEKVHLFLRKCSTLVLEFDCSFRKIFNWVLNFIPRITKFTCGRKAAA